METLVRRLVIPAVLPDGKVPGRSDTYVTEVADMAALPSPPATAAVTGSDTMAGAGPEIGPGVGLSGGSVGSGSTGP
jgi:hypothetical protein